MLLSSDSPDFTPWNHSKVNGSKRIVKIRNFSEIFLAFLTIFLTQSILSVCYCSRVAQTTGRKRERKVYVMNNFAALILASIGTIVILAVGWYVLLAIAYWKIFEKAGEPGWKALIPFYNTYSPVQIHLEPEYVLDRTGLLLTWRSARFHRRCFILCWHSVHTGFCHRQYHCCKQALKSVWTWRRIHDRFIFLKPDLYADPCIQQ